MSADQRTSKTVVAYARGAQLALWLQIIVAVIAVAASVALVLIVQDQGAKIRRQGEVLEVRAQALDSLVGLPRLIEAQRYDDAIIALTAAIGALEDGPEDESEESRLEAMAFQRPLRRALAQVQNLKGDHAGAVATMVALRAMIGADADEASSENFLLATYHCANNDPEAARPLLESEAARDASVLSGIDLGSACAPIAAQLLAAAPTTTQTEEPADPAYKIALVYMHVRTIEQRGFAGSVGERVCAAGYAMPGIETVPAPRGYPSQAEVRYYYAEQSAEAERIAAVVAGDGPPLRVRRLAGLDGLPRDRLEIWLAPNAPAGLAGPSSCSPEQREDAQAFSASIAAALNSTDRQERLRATEIALNRLRDPNDTHMAAALLRQLSGSSLESLSAAGRVNVLFALNGRATWTGPDAQALRERLDQIEARSSQGVRIGPQTQDCIDSLREKLAGRPGRATCG